MSSNSQNHLELSWYGHVRGRQAALLFLSLEPILSALLHPRDAVIQVNRSERLHLCQVLHAESRVRKGFPAALGGVSRCSRNLPAFQHISPDSCPLGQVISWMSWLTIPNEADKNVW